MPKQSANPMTILLLVGLLTSLIGVFGLFNPHALEVALFDVLLPLLLVLTLFGIGQLLYVMYRAYKEGE